MALSVDERTEHATSTKLIAYRCAECGRYLGESRMPAVLVNSATWLYSRHRCATCNRWRWFETLTGKMVTEPRRRLTESAALP